MRLPAAGSFLIAWGLGFALIATAVAVAEEAQKPSTSVLRVLSPDGSAERPAGAQLRIKRPNKPAAVQIVADAIGSPVHRKERTQSFDLSTPAADVRFAQVSEIKLKAPSNKTSATLGSAGKDLPDEILPALSSPLKKGKYVGEGGRGGLSALGKSLSNKGGQAARATRISEPPVSHRGVRIAHGEAKRAAPTGSIACKQNPPGSHDSVASKYAVQTASYDRELSGPQRDLKGEASLDKPSREQTLLVESDLEAAFSPPASIPYADAARTLLQVAPPPATETSPAAPPAARVSMAAPPVAQPSTATAVAAEPATDASQSGPFEVIDQTGELTVVMRRSKLLRTKVDVYRTAVVDPSVCDVVQFTPREVSIIGKGQGATHVTFWFQDDQHRPVTYLVRVTPDPEVKQRRAAEFEVLEEVLAALFPESKVYLTPVADKLIVRGQARDAAEAAQILAVIRGEAVVGRGVTESRAADPLSREETNRPMVATTVINMLRIPGVQQVALRVKIAELNRSAARNFGVDLDMTFSWDDGAMVVRSLLNQLAGGTASILGSFDSDDINFGIHFLERHGVVRMLSEPTLVTLSGRPASFVAGGEFAVPTTVGVEGVAAVTTDFRAFGAIITFVPTVLDKDHIRLDVAPEFSQLDTDLTTANGTPGLSTRAVTTTVEMREGQTLAIAGLLDDSMQGNHASNLPIVGRILGMRDVTRNETELIILVTPELVHPMEPEEVPPLPGFDVTEPTNKEFFLQGRIEGRPTHEYRSTIWPRLRRRYQAGGPAMISGPFGHGD